MLSAVDIPKSKSITIAFMAFKSCLFGLFLIITFNEIKSTSESSNVAQCSESLIQLSVIMKLFYILGLLLDIFLMGFFLISSKFRKMEYFILFGFHIILMGFMLVTGLVQLIRGKSQCYVGRAMVGTTVALATCFVVNSIFIMWQNLYFALKYAHLACNIVWVFMWLQCGQCSHILIACIGVIHGLLSAFGLIFFMILSFLHKNSTTAKCWRQFYMISIALMILCYVISFVGKSFLFQSNENCQPSHLMLGTYQKYGLIQVLGTLLLLIFMNTEMGDPRQGIMKEDVKVFNRASIQNRGFIIIDDTN